MVINTFLTIPKIFLHLLLCLALSIPGRAQQIELKDNFFYIDGEKFFVKGIGYEAGARPGELPWERTFNPGQLHFDIQRILSGGFNTIRTWAPLFEEDLELLEGYDIKIIMGIWIDPHGDFADPVFVNEAKNIVNGVLDYSANYDNIIAYLIMNEPLPETVFAAGYDETEELWNELIDIIHERHPGRPVSISNTCNGTFIDPGIFDFSAFNVYIYNPVTVNYLHRYRDYAAYLRKRDTSDHPLVFTEYGLSVSPSGPGNWGYGGNSLTEQTEGMLHMYKSLVDGGASGSCVFNYSDGWWKAGNENVHDDAAEEWFGLVEYTALSDTLGTERPVWQEVKDFQSVIVSQPVSSGIYGKKVPVEMFLHDDITKVEMKNDGSLIRSWEITDQYLADTITFDIQQPGDYSIDILCYSDETLIKTEEKSILVAGKDLTLPSIDISLNANCWETGMLEVEYHITHSDDFTAETQLDHIYYPHVGFNYGNPYQVTIPSSGEATITDSHSIADQVDAITIGAAFNIHFNSFEKRIVSEKTITRYDITGVSEKQPASVSSLRIHPNPAVSWIQINKENKQSDDRFTLKIFNTSGVTVIEIPEIRWEQQVDISGLPAGVYYLSIISPDVTVQHAKLLKL